MGCDVVVVVVDGGDGNVDDGCATGILLDFELVAVPSC
jgi:hypothetical protein